MDQGTSLEEAVRLWLRADDCLCHDWLRWVRIALELEELKTKHSNSMLINTSQQIDLWKEYFPETKDANKLGILINMFNIGSIISFFFT
jgi:hypothetical protein